MEGSADGDFICSDNEEVEDCSGHQHQQCEEESLALQYSKSVEGDDDEEGFLLPDTLAERSVF